MESFLMQASIYLGAAVLVVPLSVRLGLGSVLGYLAAGILMGPVMGLAGAGTADPDGPILRARQDSGKDAVYDLPAASVVVIRGKVMLP